jgi:hypothetical protein
VICVVAALIAGLVLPPGNLKALQAPEGPIGPAEPGSEGTPQAQLCRIRIVCR